MVAERTAKIRRERGNAAAPRQVISNEGDSARHVIPVAADDVRA
jgi:hypothetical protein